MDADQTGKIEIDLSDLNQTWADGHGDTYTISSHIYNYPNTTPSYTWQDLSITTPSQSSKISLQGDDADIEINGENVVSMLRDIRDRLNILLVSEEMEAEWDELRALREQYEAKLAECQKKSRAWAALKQNG